MTARVVSLVQGVVALPLRSRSPLAGNGWRSVAQNWLPFLRGQAAASPLSGTEVKLISMSCAASGQEFTQQQQGQSSPSSTTLLRAQFVRAGVRRGHGGAAGALLFVLFVVGCDTPYTYVVLDNRYPRASTNSLVVYEAFWQAISFQTPIPPGSSSVPESTIAASANTAYVVLAPGWDAANSVSPVSFIVLESRLGFAVQLNQTLHIPVDDATFIGNCTSQSHLTQAQADFLTQIVFANLFIALSYDAATCSTTPTKDAGSD